MAKNRMTQTQRIVNALMRHGTKQPGITVARLADRSGVPVENVYKRVSDLRAMGETIYSNYRTVNGERKLYYRFAA